MTTISHLTSQQVIPALYPLDRFYDIQFSDFHVWHNITAHVCVAFLASVFRNHFIVSIKCELVADPVINYYKL